MLVNTELVLCFEKGHCVESSYLKCVTDVIKHDAISGMTGIIVSHDLINPLDPKTSTRL